MLWSAVALRARTPLLVAAGRRAALSLRCFSTSVSTGSDDGIAGQDAVHWRTRAYQDKILQALQVYKKLKGDMVVPQSFIVPTDDDRWPNAAWGYRLGESVHRLRMQLQAGELHGEDRVVPTEFLNELEKLGFVRDFFRYKWNEVIMPALRRYYAVHGDLDVPHRFTIPRGDETWPKASWGLKLGCTVCSTRYLETYAKQVAADKKELERMGFCFTTIAERDWNERVLPALATYRREFGNCLVAFPFVVPSMFPWAEKAWGMNLGQTVSNIRQGGAYEEQSTRDLEILDSLDFAWNVREFVWKEQIVPALQVYSEKHGHCRMRESFFVPSRAPWPEKSWGLPLGVKLGDMRRTGTYFEYFGRDVETLDALNFNWILRADAFKKRVAPLIDLHASVTGNQDIPDDFVIPSEAPWPEEMWGVHLGLIVARHAHHLR